METATLNLPPNLELKIDIDLTDEQFFQLCQNNRDLKFERTADGDLMIMVPTGSDTSQRNSDFNFQLQAWNRRIGLGVVFESSGGFRLPNGANRSPDASWVRRERWEVLTTEQKEKFAPLCPDFVVEIRSRSDSQGVSPSDVLPKLQEKMREYIENGAILGWLLDRKNQQVEIYRPNQEVEILQSPKTLSGEDVLPGFILDLSEIL